MIFTLPPPQPPQVVYARSTPEPTSGFCGILVGGTGKRVLVSQTGKISSVLTAEMLEYLEDRANELRISFLDVYEEEMAAKAELAAITPSNAKLLEIAKTSGPPPGFLDDPEERPW